MIPALIIGIKDAMQISDVTNVTWPKVGPDGVELLESGLIMIMSNEIAEE